MKTSLLIVLAGFALFATGRVLAHHPHAPHAASRPLGHPVVLAPIAAPTHIEAEPGASRIHRTPAAAVTAARAFVSAYLLYENDRLHGQAEHRLARVSSSRLWKLLRSGRGEPTRPPHIGLTHLVRIDAGVSSNRRAAAVVSQLTRGDHSEGLTLVLRRTGRGWQVTKVAR